MQWQLPDTAYTDSKLCLAPADPLILQRLNSFSTAIIAFKVVTTAFTMLFIFK